MDVMRSIVAAVLGLALVACNVEASEAEPECAANVCQLRSEDTGLKLPDAPIRYFCQALATAPACTCPTAPFANGGDAPCTW